MTWFHWALSNAFFTSLARVLQKKAMNNYEDKSDAFSVIYQLLPALMLLTGVLIFGSPIPDFLADWHNWVIGALSFSLGSIFLFRAYSLSQVSTTSIIFSSRVVWTMVFASILLGESLGFNEISGAVLIFLGIVVVSWGNGLQFDKGNIFAVLSALFFAIGMVNEPYLLENNETLSVIAFEMMLTAPVIILLRRKSVKDIPIVIRNVNPLLILIPSAMFAFGAFSVLSAYSSGGQLVHITPVTLTSRLFIVILSYIFLDERDKMLQKIIGVILCIAGTLIIRLI